MTSTAHAPAHGTTHGSAHGPGDAHAPHRNYVKIWGILCALLVVSVVGPMLGIRWVMLVTAFGVALVKAYMVAKNFMHLDIEKPIVHWILLVALALMVLLYGALAPTCRRARARAGRRTRGSTTAS
jgi:caa(3)-type oxidase subunit IV